MKTSGRLNISSEAQVIEHTTVLHELTLRNLVFTFSQISNKATMTNEVV